MTWSPFANEVMADPAKGHSELLRSRRRAIVNSVDVPNDLLTLFAGGQFEGDLIRESDALSILVQLLVRGKETTTSLITSMVWRLLEVPRRWNAVLGDRHFSFGLGVHSCLGAPMTRLEAEISLNALLDHVPSLRLLGAGERIAPFFLPGRR